jgi:YHS domain-containing protein
MSSKVLILCVTLIVALSIGCSKDASKEEAKKEETQQTGMTKPEKGSPVKVARMSSLIDPVSGNAVDVNNVPYNYTYNDIRFHFESKENMEAFKKDPEKYLKKE